MKVIHLSVYPIRFCILTYRPVLTLRKKSATAIFVHCLIGTILVKWITGKLNEHLEDPTSSRTVGGLENFTKCDRPKIMRKRSLQTGKPSLYRRDWTQPTLLKVTVNGCECFVLILVIFVFPVFKIVQWSIVEDPNLCSCFHTMTLSSLTDPQHPPTASCFS